MAAGKTLIWSYKTMQVIAQYSAVYEIVIKIYIRFIHDSIEFDRPAQVQAFCNSTHASSTAESKKNVVTKGKYQQYLIVDGIWLRDWHFSFYVSICAPTSNLDV